MSVVPHLRVANALVGSESLDRSVGEDGSEVDMGGASADRNLRRSGARPRMPARVRLRRCGVEPAPGI